jgi:hypothetical protein
MHPLLQSHCKHKPAASSHETTAEKCAKSSAYRPTCRAANHPARSGSNHACPPANGCITTADFDDFTF